MLTTDLQKIGNRLLAYRKRSGMTQAQMAEASYLSDRAYASIVRGESDMRVITAVQICTVLNITLDDLFVEENDKDYKTIIDEQISSCSEEKLKTISRLIELLQKPV